MIKKLTYQFLFFLLLAATLHAKTARLAPEAEPIALVHGCVNVVTGEFVQQKTDLVVEGPSSISLSRIYDSGAPQVKSTLGHGFTWAFARNLKGTGSDWRACALDEREGIKLYYHKAPDKEYFKVDPRTFQVGYTNYSPGEISGANSLHNVTLMPHECKTKRSWNKDTGERTWLTEGEWIVTLGCGTKRIYAWTEQGNANWWRLSKEIRPDGNKVLYEYHNTHLTKVILADNSESTWLVAYSLEYHGDQVKAIGTNGQQVHYQLGTFKQRPKQTAQSFNRLASIASEQLIPATYGYRSHGTDANVGKIDYIEQPDHRRIDIDYHKDGRVKALKAPVGLNSTPVTFATFNYSKDLLNGAELKES